MPYLLPATRALPFQSGSETSHDAALGARTFSGDQERRYFEWLRARGAYGATDAEAALGTGIRLSSICARRNRLVSAGLVERTDQRRARGAVWRAK